MQIRIRETGQVMYESEFRSLHSNTSFPQLLSAELLDGFGADVVFEGPQAQPTRYQTAFRDGVEQIDGKWYTKYSVTDLDDEAKAAKDAEQAKSVRQQRDDKLAELDWTQGKDIPDAISGPAAVKRQVLRDVPLQAGFPWEVIWPE